MIPLSLNFACIWKIYHPNEKLSFILNARTHLPELFQLTENEKCNLAEWQQFLNIAEKESNDNLNNNNFETKFADLLIPFALSRFDIYYEQQRTRLETYNVGSLKYDAPLAKSPRNHCNFHITNMLSPKSFFDDFEYLPSCFIKLMELSEKEYGYDTLCTFSWLNSYPRWQALFPREWHENMDASDEQIWGNLGYWGQMMIATGTANKRTEEYIRKNGTLKYKPCKSYCSFEAMRNHLKKYLLECK